MEFSLNIPEAARFDSGHFRNLAVDSVWPGEIHAFFRNRPKSGLPKYRNIHGQFILFVCLKGCTCVIVEKVPCLLRENDALLVFPGQPHAQRPVPEMEDVESLLIRFSVQEMRWLPELRGQILTLGSEQQRMIREFGTAFEKAFHEPGAVRATECACRLASLLNSLRLCTGETAGGEISDASPGLAHVRKACRMLLESVDAPPSIAAVARKLGISEGHLRSLFRRYLSISPGGVWKDARLRRTQNLLLHSQLNLSEIAVECGFGSIYSFSRFFRQAAGITPSAFRRDFRCPAR